MHAYFVSMQDSEGKKRYLEKFNLDNFDSCRSKWKDDIDLWLPVSHVHIGVIPNSIMVFACSECLCSCKDCWPH